MMLNVRVKVRAREERVEWLDDTHAVVYVRAVPHDGMANDAVARVLAQALRVGVSRIRIVRGFTSKTKHIAVE